MTKTTEDWALEAIGFYEKKGADVVAIIEYIDYRDHFRYEPAKIETALKHLTRLRKVIQRGGKYFVCDQ
jgi:hypothetical protein